MGPVFPPLKELLNESRSLHSKALFHILMVFPLTHGLCLVSLFGAYSLVQTSVFQTPRNLIPPLIPSLEQLRGFPLNSRKRPWSDESLWGPALVCLCSHFPSSPHSGFRWPDSSDLPGSEYSFIFRGLCLLRSLHLE